MAFDENLFEQSIIRLFEDLGYEHFYGPNIERDYHNPLYEDQLRNSLSRLNPNLNQDIIKTAISPLKDINEGSLEQRNFKFREYLQNGMTVNYVENNEDRAAIVHLVDFENTNALPSIKAEKHSQPIPKIQSQDAIIEIHHDGNTNQISLSELEDKIDSIIQAEGKKLVMQKKPTTIDQKEPEQYITDLL